MELTSLVSPGLWCLTVGAGTANVAIKDRVAVSQACGLTTVASVAADYMWQYSQHGDPARLAGVITFGIVAARVGLIMANDFSDRTRFKIVCASFAGSTALSVGGQLAFKHGYDPRTLLLTLSGGVGCLADYTKNMVTRRRSTFVVGLSTAVFGAMTNNWGVVAKNVVADISSNAYFMRLYRDPLPRMPAVFGRKKTGAEAPVL